MDTFLVSPGALAESAVTLEGPEGHHAADVVRVREGDLVRLIDGEGGEAVARVESIGRSEATLSVEETRTHERGSGVHLTVVQALLKGRGFDEVVRRCSELGVAAVVPASTARSIGRIPAGGEEARVSRWRSIALAAVKQSRGVFLPRIDRVRDLGSVVGLTGDHDLSLVAWEEEGGTALRDALAGGQEGALGRILLVVGPEGGLESAEVGGLTAAGARAVGLGRRVLRADWAAAAAAAMISSEVGGLLP
jgi:16S rRNA (uracil1498-N3)-methyltransferase